MRREEQDKACQQADRSHRDNRDDREMPEVFRGFGEPFAGLHVDALHPDSGKAREDHTHHAREDEHSARNAFAGFSPVCVHRLWKTAFILEHFAGQQLIDGYAKQAADLDDVVDIRLCRVQLPFGNRLPRYAELFRQLLLPKEAERMIRLLTMADKLVSTLPFYVLNCDMTENSVLRAYEAAK